MNHAIFSFMLIALAGAPGEKSGGEKLGVENPVFTKLLAQGIMMSDGTALKLHQPIMADGLDAAKQLAAMEKVADAHAPVEQLVRKSYYSPVVTKIRTIRAAKGDGPAVRTVDVWFVVHGDWNTLTSKDFLESMTGAEAGKSRVVTKSGFLTKKEMQKRKLSATSTNDREERFLYTTFSLFEQVEISATRFAVVTRGKNYVLAAGKIDSRFDNDPDYPNQWRPLLRDAQANVKPGPAHPFSYAGGYAKITRLNEPADAVFVECHLVYEEPYGWFEGIDLVKQKVPAMVREKVRLFRQKLAVASEKKWEWEKGGGKTTDEHKMNADEEKTKAKQKE